MKIKEIDRTAYMAWSPAQTNGIYLAAGTAAQHSDGSLTTSSSGTLELYSFDINRPGLDMPILASLPCESSFHKLIWGCHGMKENEDSSSEHPSGLIVAGCERGLMQVYDASKILSKEDAIVLTKTKHTGAVCALDFNTFRSNLLASGASESEIFIWDLNNPKTLMTPGAKAQPAADVTHLAWNKQVEHILASSFATGCVVWDLRKNEPIIKIADTTTSRYKVVEWHPTVATQMCLACDDSSSPVIQLWDLRYATSPLKILQGHQGGVLGLSWCQQDPELLLSCGKDSKIICWNPNYPHPGYEALCEIPTTSQESFDLSFCPKNPLVFSASSLDGRISILGLSGGAQLPVTSSKLADSFPGMDMSISQTPVPAQKPVVIQLRDAPKWLKRPCGASFAFGGKLITFENVKQPAVQGQQSAPDQRLVTISQVVTLPEFVARSQRLETALQSGNLGEFCRQKSTETLDEDESNVWQFLQASFAPNPNHEYLNMLGCNSEEVHAKLANLLGTSEEADKDVDSITAGFVSLAQGDSFGNQLGPVDNGAVFDQISQKAHDSPLATQQPILIPTDESNEGLLNQALLTGNIEFAVDLCLRDGRWADALILASTGGPDLIKKAQLKYFKECHNETSNMIRAIVTRDLKRIVEKCDLECWKQALATALTYADEREFGYLAEILGKRLEESADETLKKSSLLCYICCGNLNRLVESWAHLKEDESDDIPSSLQDVVEQVMILKKAAEVRGRAGAVTSGPLASKIVEYATLLASQGYLEAALSYLSDSSEPSLVSLRDRLYYALGRQKPVRQPRSRQTSESYHRSSLTQKRPSYPSNPPVTNVFQPAPTTNGYPNYADTTTHAYNSVPQPAHPPKVSGSLPMPPVSSSAHGWNDPPSVSMTTKPKRPPSSQPLEPITHPLFGAAPNQPNQASGDNFSNTAYGTNFSGYGAPPPPPPSALNKPPQSTFTPGPQSTFTPGPPQSMFTPAPPQSTFTPGPPSAFNNGPPQSMFTPGPPQSNFTPGPPQSNFTPGPPQSNFTPGPPQSNFTPGPPQSNFTPGPPQSNFTPGPPQTTFPSQNFPPPTSGFPMSSGSILPPSTALPPVAPPPSLQGPSSVFQPSAPPSLPTAPIQTFTPAVVPQPTFTPPPTFNPGATATSTLSNLPAKPAVEAEPPVPKGPIPDEHQEVVDIFEKLRSDCYAVAALPQMKRKLEDVARKMEIFCDKLREGSLSANTLTSLHNIAEAMKNHDYQLALSIHTQLVTAGNFAEISTFLPSIKVLIQSAAQLNVFL